LLAAAHPEMGARRPEELRKVQCFVRGGLVDRPSHGAEGDRGRGRPVIQHLFLAAPRNIRIQLALPDVHRSALVAVGGGVGRLAVRLGHPGPVNPSVPCEALEVRAHFRVDHQVDLQVTAMDHGHDAAVIVLDAGELDRGAVRGLEVLA
jgi:hypothetical protein